MEENLVQAKWNFALFAAREGENINSVIYLLGIFFISLDLIFDILTKELPHHFPGFARGSLPLSQCLWEAAGRLEEEAPSHSTHFLLSEMTCTHPLQLVWY